MLRRIISYFDRFTLVGGESGRNVLCAQTSHHPAIGPEQPRGIEIEEPWKLENDGPQRLRKSPSAVPVVVERFGPGCRNRTTLSASLSHVGNFNGALKNVVPIKVRTSRQLPFPAPDWPPPSADSPTARPATKCPPATSQCAPLRVKPISSPLPRGCHC